MDDIEELLEEDLPDVAIEVDFGRLSPAARTALDCATLEAHGLGDEFVGTEHVLLGLSLAETGAACRILASLEITTEQLRARLHFIRGGVRTPIDDENEPLYSPRLLRVLEFAAKESTKRNHPGIATLHLLSGLLRERAGLAAFLLESPGVGYGRAGSVIALAYREGWNDDAPSQPAQ